jgi:phosphate transport system substrate-binding protein
MPGPGTPSPLDASTRFTPVGPVPRIVHRTAGRARWGFAFGAIAVVALLVVGGIWGGWFEPASGPSSRGSCPTGITLLGEGASFLLPILSQWAANFQSNRSDSVNYNPAGAGAGISALSERQVDFAATDEPLSPDQYEAMPGAVLTLPVTGGALAIVYHLTGPSAPLRLNASVLAGIYLGTITMWNAPTIAALNPGVPLPAQRITTVHRADAAGTTYVLTQYLAAASPSWSSGPGIGIQPSWPSAPSQQAVQGNSKVVQYVEAAPGSIGYADLTDVVSASGLEIAAMENPSGRFLLPTLSDTASAIADISANTTFPAPSLPWTNVSLVDSPSPGDYPLATFSYLLVVRSTDLGFEPSMLRSEVLSVWLGWVITDGQNASTPLDYVALPPSLEALDASALATLTFHGRTVGCNFG